MADATDFKRIEENEKVLDFLHRTQCCNDLDCACSVSWDLEYANEEVESILFRDFVENDWTEIYLNILKYWFL